MNNPWEAEFPVTADDAERLIRDQFPELGSIRLQNFGQGWDNTAYLVNDTYIFRFPRRPLAVELIQVEQRALPLLAKLLPIPIPDPVFQGRPTPAYPHPFAGYRKLPGRSACRANLTQAQRTALAEPLGRFLKELHHMGTRMNQKALPGDQLGRTNFTKLKTRILETIEQLRADFPSRYGPAAAALLATDPRYHPRRDLLIHGDLYLRHLLVDERARLVGVIDWGDLHLGDPAPDLSIAWTLLPAGAHHLFRAAYGPISPESWHMARLRALNYGVILRRYGLDQADADLIRESAFMLEQTLG